MKCPRYALVICVTLFSLSESVAQLRLPSAIEDQEGMVKSEARRYKALMGSTISSSADPNIDVTYYGLTLSIATTPPYIRGVVRMNAVSTVDSLASVTLDLMESMTVDSVKTGGASLPFATQPATMTIMLDRTYGRGELVSVDISYQGVPGSSGFGSFTFSSFDGTPWVWTLSEPYGARDWWPCKDHPVDKADSVDLWVTVDSTFKVGSNGTLVSVVSNGDGTKTHHWAERYPISTYLVSLAITNYAEFTNWFVYSPTDSMPVLNYVLPAHLPGAQANLRKAVEMLRVFSDKFGLYPFIKEKYGHAEFGWGGGMEHQTMTSIGGFSEGLVAHELAHSWFGDMITCAAWPHIWLNEGFATYAVALYREAEYGVSSYWSYMNGVMSSATNAVGSLYVQDTSDVSSLFDWSLVYAKGATVLHMLRHVMGDSLFFASLKAYAGDPRFRFGVATTEDFEQVCESVSGAELSYFFNEWINGSGYPRYEYSWTAVPDTDGGYQVPIRIRQTGGDSSPQFFTMPVDFRLTGSLLDTTVVLWNNLDDQYFQVRVSQLPTMGELDPENWILKASAPLSVEETVPPPVPATFELFQNYPNPFNPVTKIRLTIADRRLTVVSVYDVLGREVATLMNEVKDPGTYEVVFDASGLASGVYLYKMQVRGSGFPLLESAPTGESKGGTASARDSDGGAGDFTLTRRLLVLR